MAGIEHNLTSYVSRHSWATIVSTNGVPINVISKGLEHNDIKTTQIYLADCGNEEVDEANAHILK